MTVRVLDASVVVLQVAPPPGLADVRRRFTDTVAHAPHLVDAECGHVFRRAVRRGELTADEGWAALRAASALIDTRHGHASLAQVAWTLRDRLTYYDALYVSLAARLDAPLVTADRRLAAAHDLPCRVELVG